MDDERPDGLQYLRLAAIYFCCFGGLGALFPLLPLVLQSRGFSPGQIAALMVLLPVATLAVPPLWGLLADIHRARTPLLRLAMAGAGASALLLGLPLSLWTTAGAMVVHAIFRAPLASLADAIAHARLGSQRERFARVRVWGSVGFAVCVAAVGLLGASGRPPLLVGITCAVYILGALATVGLDGHAGPRQRVRVSEALGHLRSPPVICLLVATAFYYGGHAAYDAFFSLHLRRIGFDDAIVGLAWSIGVMVEVGVMLSAPRLMGRSAGLLPLCAVVAALRWVLLSKVEGTAPILLLQSLHGITFGLWYLSLVKEVQDRAPGPLRAAHQAITLSAMGLGMVGGYLGGGALFGQGGGPRLFAWAAGAALLSLGFYGLRNLLLGRR